MEKRPKPYAVVPSRRKNRASVAPTMNGTISAVLVEARAASRASDIPQRRVDGRGRRRRRRRRDEARPCRRGRRGPRRACARPRPRSGRAACGCRSAGRRESGITLIFVPPWAMVGAKVVWVQAWNWRAMPIGSASMAPMKSSGDRAAGRPAPPGSPSPSRNRRQMSWISVAGAYSAIRWTTAAAVTRALSVL